MGKQTNNFCLKLQNNSLYAMLEIQAKLYPRKDNFLFEVFLILPLKDGLRSNTMEILKHLLRKSH